MKNPYARLRELCGYTQRGYCEKYHFGKMSLVYMEAGLYPEVSERFNRSLAEACREKGVSATQILSDEFGVPTLAEAYHLWQTVERNRASDELARVVPPFKYNAKASPFANFVGATGSVQGFCKKLKVPAATTTRYMDGTTRTMPKVIEQALREVRYPYLRDLIETQGAWVQAHKE